MKQLHSEYNLEQIITDCTRVVGTLTEDRRQIISNTLLGHFSTNKVKYVLKSGSLELGMVDHFLIFAVRKVNARRLNIPHQTVIETRNLRICNKPKFLADLQPIDWNTILNPLSNNPDKMAPTFHKIHAHLKKRMVRIQYALGLPLEPKEAWKSGINWRS